MGPPAFLPAIKRLSSSVTRPIQVGVPPETLGSVTSVRALEATGVDQDGRISLQSFQGWFFAAAGGLRGLSTNGELETIQQEQEMKQAGGLAAARKNQIIGHGQTMLHARKVLCLNCFSVDDLMETFAEVAMMASRNMILLLPRIACRLSTPAASALQVMRRILIKCYYV